MSPPPDDDDDTALPTKITVIPVKPSRFDRVAVDYTINQKLQDLIPKEANSATVTVKIKSLTGEERILTGVLATRIGEKFGLALGGAIDLNNRQNYEIEFLGVVSWA